MTIICNWWNLLLFGVDMIIGSTDAYLFIITVLTQRTQVLKCACLHDLVILIIEPRAVVLVM